MHLSPGTDSATDGGPLAGKTVIAIEHSVAGPLATRILSELGAEVIKVERPGHGDFARHWDDDVQGEGAQFWWLNRQKKSIELDLKSAAGRRDIRALLARADVLLHNLAPSSAARLGLDGPAVAAEFPHLVNCQISGYGTAGGAANRKAYDMLVQAEAGVMSLTGTPEQPMRVGVSISDVTTGIYSALLVLAALLDRQGTGAGRHLDVAMLDVTMEFLGPMMISYLNAQRIYPRIPDQHHAIAPYGVFTCGDGERVLLAIEQDAEWRRFALNVLAAPELATDPRYETNVKRLSHREELSRLVGERIAAQASADLVAALAAAGLAYARVNDVSLVAEHEVVGERGIITRSRTADGTQVRCLSGIAERVFERPPPWRDRPPALGEDTELVLAGLGSLQGTASPGPAHE